MKALSIVVLGGTGFVGSHLLPRLAADGHRLTVLTRNRSLHMAMKVLPTVEVVATDVYDREQLRNCFRGADVVINLVGILNESGFGGKGFQRAHPGLTQTIVDACEGAGVRRLLQMSSLNAGAGESHYLRSRGEAEDVVRRSGLDWTIFQPSVIFGPGDGIFTRFAVLGRLAVFGLPLAKPRSRMAPVYVNDVCEAFARSLVRSETVGQTYELYGPRVYTLIEIVRYALEVAGYRRMVLGLPDFLGRIQALVCDFIPGKPFSTDNFLSLKIDSVGNRDGLAALDIAPTPVEAVVPRYLGGNLRQRRYSRMRSNTA